MACGYPTRPTTPSNWPGWSRASSAGSAPACNPPAEALTSWRQRHSTTYARGRCVDRWGTARSQRRTVFNEWSRTALSWALMAALKGDVDGQTDDYLG